VDHSLATPVDFRHNRLTFVLGAIAAAEALVILAAAVVLLAKPLARKVKSAAIDQAAASLSAHKTGPKTPAGKPTLPRTKTAVIVLNGNGVTGAAAAAARPVRRLGYPIRKVDNAHRSDYPHSVVMYRKGFRPEAMRLGRDLHVKIVGPLDGIRVGEMHRAQLVYVVGG
jgi:hypothetical protein